MSGFFGFVAEIRGFCDWWNPRSTGKLHKINWWNLLFKAGFRVSSQLGLMRTPSVHENCICLCGSELSFIGKNLGFVQTRDQELSIALFKSIKLQLPKKFDLVYIFESEKLPRLSCDLANPYRNCLEILL